MNSLPTRDPTDGRSPTDGARTAEHEIRVLYVDDYPEFSELAATFLELREDPIFVDVATSAEMGLRKLESDHFDCVVSDYDMPGMDGIEFLHAVRERYPDLPFILFTGKGSEAVASEAITAGVTEYLQKRRDPRQYERLWERIQTAVDERAGQTNYRQLFEQTPVGVLVLDPEHGTIIEANQAFGALLGYDPADLVGRHPGELSPAGSQLDREKADQLIGSALEDGTARFEWQEQTQSCDVIWVEVTLTQTTIEGEQRVLAAVHETTERTEREMDLEEQVIRVEEFAEAVSEELRNPLNVAVGNLELAMEESPNAHLETIHEAHRRMDDLIDDLLTVARGDEVGAEVEPVALDQRIEGAWATVAPQEATLCVELDRMVLADARRVTRVFENLLRTVVDHGGDTVTVTVGELDDGFYVADDGNAIADEIRKDVRGDGYPTSDAERGFNLSIIRQIAAAHDWTIDVTTDPDGGARFEVTGVDFVDVYRPDVTVDS